MAKTKRNMPEQTQAVDRGATAGPNPQQHLQQQRRVEQQQHLQPPQQGLQSRIGDTAGDLPASQSVRAVMPFDDATENRMIIVLHGQMMPNPPNCCPVANDVSHENESNLALAIIATICCLPFGLLSVIQAVRAEDKFRVGEVQHGKRLAQSAMNYALMAISLGVLTATLVIVGVAVISYRVKRRLEAQNSSFGAYWDLP